MSIVSKVNLVGKIEDKGQLQGHISLAKERPNLQNKNVEITQNTTQTITADEEYNGLGEVKVTTNIPLPSGLINITQNGTTDVANYGTANVNVQPNLQNKSQTIRGNETNTIQADAGYDGLGTVTVTTDVVFKVPDGMRFGYSSALPNEMDTSECTNMSSFFWGCSAITTIPFIDTSSVTRMDAMFRDCNSLREVYPMVTNNVTRMDGMFRNCTSLRDVPALNASSVTTMNFMFINCNQLTDESLDNVLYMCATTSAAYNRPKTLSEIGVTRDQAMRCQSLAGYQGFIDAGWSTGY